MLCALSLFSITCADFLSIIKLRLFELTLVSTSNGFFMHLLRPADKCHVSVEPGGMAPSNRRSAFIVDVQRWRKQAPKGPP